MLVVAVVKPYYRDERATLHHGDCLDVLALLDAVDERDALATAIERVRALHVEQYAGCCNACDSLWPCDTIRALDESEADKCPTYCGDCGESLADMPCDHCGGSGCGPGTASGAYEECGWCAGAGVLATHHRARRKRDRQCAERPAWLDAKSDGPMADALRPLRAASPDEDGEDR